jgi:Transposase, Mutator family.
MNQFTTETMYALARKEDLPEVFRQHLEMAINELLQAELTEFLGYSRYNRGGFNTGNSRNGEFQQRTLPAYDRRSDAL